MVPEGERPHPGRSYGRGVGFEDAADNDAISQHIIIIIIPFAGWTTSRCAFEDQREHHLIQWRLNRGPPTGLCQSRGFQQATATRLAPKGRPTGQRYGSFLPAKRGAHGSGAPKGARNGNYRHGFYTAETIAERRAVRALIRKLMG
jgi:hypothetical protein